MWIIHLFYLFTNMFLSLRTHFHCDLDLIYHHHYEEVKKKKKETGGGGGPGGRTGVRKEGKDRKKKTNMLRLWAPGDSVVF